MSIEILYPPEITIKFNFQMELVRFISIKEQYRGKGRPLAEVREDWENKGFSGHAIKTEGPCKGIVGKKGSSNVFLIFLLHLFFLQVEETK